MSSYNALGHTIEAYRPGSGLMAAAVLASLLAGAELVVPKLQRYPEHLIADEDCSDVLAFGGLKHANATFMKRFMEPVIGPVASVRYPQQGLKLDVMSSDLSQYFSKLAPETTIGVAGQSLGLVTSMKALATCVGRGFNVPKIDTLWGISSPMDAQDIKNSKKYRLLPSFATRMKSVMMGTLGDIVTEVVPAENPVQAGRAVIRRTIREHCDTQTTQQWGTMLGLAYTDTQRDLDILADNGVLGAHTTARLFYKRGDTVILAEQAAVRIATKLGKLGVTSEVIMIEGTDHGSLEDVPETFWLRNKRV